MISYLSGKIILKREKFIIINVNDVGYRVFLSKKALLSVPKINENINIFCFLNVRENSLTLYGFLNPEDLEFFEILSTIRGVGPKASLELSSLGSLEKIRQRIEAHDEKLFDGIPGIGKKRAMAIILELSGKIKDLSKKTENSEKDEAETALVNLGFSDRQVKQALKDVPISIKETEKRVEQALKILGQK
ncbi:MAG: Holliday junction branch migration protein RuvA [Candidatus Nealsonbacteria bacterium]